MRGTLQIAKFANIPVLVHWSFGLILVYIGYLNFSEGGTWADMLVLSAIFLLLYVCVIMHEYGHALTARRYGVDTRDIIMFPIGGVARLERIPEKPMQEFFIAIAGPLVNVVIAICLVPLVFTLDPEAAYGINLRYPELLDATNFSWNIILPTLFVSNIVLVLFNLIPAFPMDGGRVLRSLLSIKLGRLRATQIAAILGQIVAVGFLIWGLYSSHFITALIGVFVFFAARNEYQMVQQDSLLSNHTVRDILRPHFTHISIHDTLEKPILEFEKGQEQHFLVQDDFGKIIGVLPNYFLEDAIQKQEHARPVLEKASRMFEFITPDESLKSFHHKVLSKGYRIFPVFENGTIIGVVDTKGFEDFIAIQKKFKK